MDPLLNLFQLDFSFFSLFANLAQEHSFIWLSSSVCGFVSVHHSCYQLCFMSAYHGYLAIAVLLFVGKLARTFRFSLKRPEREMNTFRLNVPSIDAGSTCQFSKESLLIQLLFLLSRLWSCWSNVSFRMLFNTLPVKVFHQGILSAISSPSWDKILQFQKVNKRGLSTQL